MTCPPWEYATHPQADEILKLRCGETLLLLANDPDAIVPFVKDTRAKHRRIFSPLTPAGHRYYAGHYRGENYKCLKNYEVTINGDSRVGHPAVGIEFSMQMFNEKTDNVVRAATEYAESTDVVNPHRFLATIQLIAALMVYFLEIHPYANGNGHMGRFILFCLLYKFNIRLRSFPVHPRPNEPFVECIKMYRDGNENPLIRYILGCGLLDPSVQV